MADNRFPHLFIQNPSEVTPYTSPKSGGGGLEIPLRNRAQHGNFLKKKLKKLWEQSKKENKERQAVSLPFKAGHYIEFRSQAGFDLITKSLENMRSGIRLLNIREEEIKDRNKPDNRTTQKTTIATVYVPDNKAPIFLQKIEEYLTKETKTGNAKNKNLVESIEDIRLVVLESFWQDDKTLMPENNEVIDCEVWLRTDQQFLNKKKEVYRNNDLEKFFETCKKLNNSKQHVENRLSKIKYEKNQSISFPERLVVLIKADKEQLIEIIKSSDLIAEIRRAKETAQFWLEQDNKDQTEWVKDLQKRLIVDKDSKVSICLLDTGVNNGHPLIAPVLSDEDCHTVNPKWGVDDQVGHGTKMSGLAVYGDLQKAFESSGQINIRHRLESVKLIPKSGTHHEKGLYGYCLRGRKYCQR